MVRQVFAKINDARRIVEVTSSGFIDDLTGWIQIDEGSGDRYYHAQGNYFAKPIMDERGVYRYVLDENDKPYELTQEEMDADYVPPVTQPTQEERIAALEAALTAIGEGITSV